ncbi:Deoxyribonuclease-2-beta [Dissostichus eleginoides]|uniref:Deoxyribonuclease-2-alpha n=1 Tax=Dissostichus eleginoides TaxID=100907 RepID=A0AAD9C7Y1_DISEL|nr:Deoxyribonuclease-2-beta [Dissostichus eleginoides]
MMVLLLTVGIVFQLSESRVTCRNDEGNEVDWYILYKLPLGDCSGLSYLYMDESTNGWKLSRNTIDSSSGTLANTLEPLLDFYDRQTEGFGYILYNDQLEKKAVSPSFGHSKGLQLMYIHPYAYDHFIPKTFHMELQNVAQMTGYPTEAPWFSVEGLTSLGGNYFSSFAKYTRFHDDLYSGLIVKYMPESLYVKGWGNKGGSVLLMSNCSTRIPHHVYNVKKVQLWKGLR